MAERDYSATPLHKKLGIKEGSKVGLVNEPDDFEKVLGKLPDGARIYDRASSALDVIVLFSTNQTHLGRRFAAMLPYLDEAGGFWVAYPKKSSTLETDLTFEVVQKKGLDLGLVDNKSCAIDDDWSAVRFVYRLKERRSKK